MKAVAKGFSLLEAIVAMVLIATAGLALFAWINGSFLSLERIQSANARALAETNALQFMQTINPMKTPIGKTSLGNLAVEWNSRPLTPPRSNLGSGEGPGPFTMALYEIDVSIEQLPDLPRDTFVIRQIGFERAPYQADPFAEPVPAKPPAANGTTGKLPPGKGARDKLK